MKCLLFPLSLSFALSLSACGAGLSESGVNTAATSLRAADAAFAVAYERQADTCFRRSETSSEYAGCMEPFDHVSDLITQSYRCLLDAVAADDPNAFGCAPLVGKVLDLVGSHVQ